MKAYNILTIDGGGIRGIIVLKQLVKLEELLDMPLYKAFDLISGTSTGGIIAILLSCGYSAKDVLNFYVSHSKNIFKKRFLRFGLFRPKYDDTYFNEVIKKYINETKLSESCTDSITIGYNMSTRDKLIFNSMLAKSNKMNNYNLTDVIRCTASAPTFFKPVLLNKNYIIDGGLVINNPSLLCYDYIINSDIEYDKLNILSFSTGTQEKKLKTKLFGGLLNWIKPTIQILLTEQAQMTHYHLSQLYKKYKPGTYTRCESVIIYSDGQIDNADCENINNMLNDGVLSVDMNLEKLQIFSEILLNEKK